MALIRGQLFRLLDQINYCTDLEGLKDTSPRAPDRSGSDVSSQAPCGDSRILITSCVGCHVGRILLVQRTLLIIIINFIDMFNGDSQKEIMGVGALPACNTSQRGQQDPVTGASSLGSTRKICVS